MNKLYVDDVRECPPSWEVARSYTEAMMMLSLNDYDEVSLDHDIASFDSEGNEMTGYTILCYLERQLLEHDRKIPYIHIHTANAAVRKKMEQVSSFLNELNARRYK